MSTNKSIQKESNNKADIGPGGCTCECCNPWGRLKKHGKMIINRIFRRKSKQELNKVDHNNEKIDKRTNHN